MPTEYRVLTGPVLEGPVLEGPVLAGSLDADTERSYV